MRINLIGLIIVLVGISTFLPKLGELEYLSGSLDPYRSGIIVLCGLIAMAEGFIWMLQNHRAKLEKKVSDDGHAILQEKFDKLSKDFESASAENLKIREQLKERDATIEASNSEKSALQAAIDQEKKAANTEKERYQLALQEADSKLQTLETKLESAGQVAGKGEDQVVKFLSLLQKKGRILDFLMDDISQRPDAQVGAVARIVHQGCLSVMKDFFQISPLRQESEGSSIEIPKDFSSKELHLTGNTNENHPEKGKIIHRGWVTEKVDLPQVVESNIKDSSHKIIAPAEIQV